MANTVPITSKPQMSEIQPNATLLGVQKNEDGVSALYQFPIQSIKQTIQDTPVLLDTFAVAEGEEPVLFFDKRLTGQKWKRVWLSGEIISSDTISNNQQFHLRTSAGTEIIRLKYNRFQTDKVYISAEMQVMPNGKVVGEITLSKYQYTNEDNTGTSTKSVGRFNTEYINGVHISLDNQTQMFAAGTRIEVWGMDNGTRIY